MKQFFKSFLSATVCAALAFVCTGCDGYKSRELIINETDGAKSDKTELTFLGYKADAENLTAIESAMQRFMDKNENINVFYEGIKGDAYWRAFYKRAETHNLDDLVMLDHDSVLQLSQNGQLLDMSGLAGVDNFSESALSQFRLDDGSIYCLPLATICYSMYVNESLLKEHGFDIPKNLSEFAAQCDYFVLNGITPIIANNFTSLGSIVIGKSLFDVYRSDDRKEILEKFNSGEIDLAEKLRPGLEFVAEMKEKKWIDPEEIHNTNQTSDDLKIFAEGNRPFMLTGHWATVRVKMMEHDFDYSVYPYPILEDGYVAAIDYATTLGINSESKNIEETKKLAEFMIQRDIIENYCDSQSSFSPLKERFVLNDKTILPLTDSIKNRYVFTDDYNLTLPIFNSLRTACLNIIDGESVDKTVNDLHVRLYGEAAAGNN